MTDKNDALFLVRLPFGQKTIPYEEVPELIAMAKSPGYDGEKASEHEALMLALDVCQEEGPLKAAVRAGEVEVLSKSLHRMGPPFIGGLEDTVLTVRALREYVESINGFLEIDDAPEPQATTPSPAPVSIDEIDFDMLATRQQLIEVFGKFSGMSLAWFDNLNDSPKLEAARKYTGQGGRHSAEPLFCPYEVMQWLADPKLKKCKPLNDTTAWRLLKGSFGKVYNLYSIGDPNAD